MINSIGDDIDADELSYVEDTYNDKLFIRALCCKLDRLKTLYSIHLDLMGLIEIALTGSYDYLALVEWIYYVTDKDLVKDVSYAKFKVDFSKRGFSGHNILTYSPWFKDLCGDLEQLSLLRESVPLSDPRMNMTP